jgi:hypothetical protein
MKSTREYKETEKERVIKSKRKPDSVGTQMKQTMKKVTLHGAALGFNKSLDTANFILRKCFNIDPKKTGGDDQITGFGLAAAVVPTVAAGAAAAVISPFVAGYDQAKRALYKLSKEDIEWMQLYGIPLIKNCDEQHMAAFALILASRNFYDHDLKDKKEIINYINNINNNGLRSYATLFNALKSAHPKSHLETTVNLDKAENIVLEYLFEDFKMYKTP